MARDKVELLVEIIGKDGITKLLDTAATEALKLERNLKKGSKRGNMLAKSVRQIGNSWSDVVTGLNQGLELFSKIGGAAQAVNETVKQTIANRQIEAQFVEKINFSVEKLSQAAGFQLSDVDLKRFALQAQQAGVSMTQFQKLLDVSLRASTATGLDFEQVFEGLFVDTVVGATDSFLEQLGVVADLGTVTEKYAAEQGIAKDQIDKTVQSQAALALVLGDVSKRFEGVTVDNFVSELSRANRAVDDFSDQFDKAVLFALKDFIDFVDRGSVKQAQAFQRYKEALPEIERLQREVKKFGEGTEAQAEASDKLSTAMVKLGNIAKLDQAVMTDLFKTLDSHVKLELDLYYGNAAQKAELYDKKLVALAKAYGLADVAQREHTKGAKAVNQAMAEVRRLADEARDAISRYAEAYPQAARRSVDLSKELTKELGDDEDLKKEVEKEQKRAKARTDRQRRRIQAARRAAAERRRQAQRDNDEFFKLQKKFMLKDLELAEIRETQLTQAEAREFDIGFRDSFFDTLDEDFAEGQFLEGLESQLFKLAEAMRDVGAAATSMDEAVTTLGGSPGFANAAEQGARMAASIMKFSDANEKTSGTYGELASGIVTASGEAALGFIEGEKARAAISAVMETANAGAMFAKFAATGAPNFAVAGSMHLVNAGMYAAIAGGAGGGGGAGRGGAGAGGGRRQPSGMRDIPTFGQQAQTREMQSANVVVNMSGAIVAGANRRKTANDLGDLVNESMGARR